MIEGKSVLAVVPARGGSKGIRLKNLRQVGGVPLVAKVGSVIKELPFIDLAVVSTDHDDIAQVAQTAGLQVPFRRPESLSGDQIGDLDVLTHALQQCESIYDKVFDVVLMLQPTSPLREAGHVEACVSKLILENWDSVWTVSRTDSKAHPLKQLYLDGTGTLEFWDPAAASIIARQQLSPVYHRNGIAYAFTRDCLLTQKSIKGARAGALVVEGEHVSIDTNWDIDLVEFILSRQTTKN